jgi:hypothetical protein
LNFSDDIDEADWLVGIAGSVSRPRRLEFTIFVGPESFEEHARILLLPDPTPEIFRESDLDEKTFDDAPEEFETLVAVSRKVSLLSGSEECLSCLFWTGYPYDVDFPDGPEIDLGGMRQYRLARGSIQDLDDFKNLSDDVYPPGFIWPRDRSWCLAYDVDSHFIGVSGSREVVKALRESVDLDVQSVKFGDAFPLYD